jgi:Ca2+-binding EF-hand superfamily protein
MGCTGSDLSEDQSLLANVLQLRVEDIRKLFGVFVHICVNERDRIDVREVFDFMGLEESRFARKLFSTFDTNGSAEINFTEFVLSLWNFCSLSKSTLGGCHIAGYYMSREMTTLLL